MNFDLLVETLTDSVRPESCLNINAAVRSYCSSWWDIGKSSSRIGVQNTFTYLLKVEIYIKVADILDFDCLLGILVKENSSHEYKSVLWFNLHLRSHSFSLNFATNRVLICEEFDWLWESLLFDWLELNYSLERTSRLNFFETVQHIKRAKNGKRFLLELSLGSTTAYHNLPNSSSSYSYFSKIKLSMINSENLRNWCCGHLKEVDLSWYIWVVFLFKIDG